MLSQRRLRMPTRRHLTAVSSLLVVTAGLFRVGIAPVAAQNAPPTAPAANSPAAATRTLTGTVLDATTGAPIQGAVVYMEGLRPAKAATPTAKYVQSAYREFKIPTDSEGQFTRSDIALDEDVECAVKASNYQYASGGDVTTNAEGGLEVTLRMTKTDGHLTGVVVSGSGAPVVGAIVWADNALLALPVTTDAKGAFTLSMLPEGVVKIEAARGNAWAETTVSSTDEGKNAPPVSLALHATPQSAEPTAATLLAAMIAYKKGERGIDRSDLTNYLARTDLKAALELAASAHKEGETLPDGVIANLIEGRLKMAPLDAAAWAQPRIPLIGQAMTRVRSACEIGIALADTHPAMAAQWYASCQTDAEIPNAAVDMNRARLVALAALIHNPADEARHLQRLDAALDGTQQWKYDRLHCAEQVARGDIAAGEKLIAPLSPAEQADFYIEVVTRCLKNSPSLSRVYLAKLQKLLPSVNDVSRQSDASRVALRAIETVGPSDPVNAIAIARSVPEDEKDLYPLALTTAARFQTDTVAAPLWTTAIEKARATQAGYRAPHLLALAAIAARGPSAATIARAQALWEEGIADAANSSPGYRVLLVPENSLLVARFAPSIARMLYQREYAEQSLRPPGFTNRWGIVQAAIGMALVDPARAEMLCDRMPPLSKREQADMARGRFGGDPYADFARLQIIRLLTLSPERRLAVTSDMLFDSGHLFVNYPEEIEDAR